jgi:hypothetical protein
MKIKKNHLIFCLLLFLNICLFPNSIYSQAWEGSTLGSVSNEWAFNVNFGFLSYFGDLSIHDYHIPGKIENESGKAGGVMVSKKITKPFGLSAQFISGQFKARKGNIYFESSIIEYNVSAYIELLSLLKAANRNKVGLQVFAGIGNFLFNSTKYEYYEGETVITAHKSRVPEFVSFIGMGIHYKLSEKFSIMSSLAIKQCQNDKIDVYVKTPDYDYYSYCQFGLTYHFKPVVNAYVHNRARIAHNGTRLKPLK